MSIHFRRGLALIWTIRSSVWRVRYLVGESWTKSRSYTSTLTRRNTPTALIACWYYFLKRSAIQSDLIMLVNDAFLNRSDVGKDLEFCTQRGIGAKKRGVESVRLTLVSGHTRGKAKCLL